MSTLVVPLTSAVVPLAHETDEVGLPRQVREPPCADGVGVRLGVRLEQCVPRARTRKSKCSISDEIEGWELKPIKLARCQQQVRKARQSSTSTGARNFYQKQEDMLESFQEADRLINDSVTARLLSGDAGDDVDRTSQVQSWLITGSLGVNVLLFVMKFYVLIQSNSVSVLSSVVDSGLDLFSGLVIFLVAVFMRKRNRYLYPMGKGRFDALATIVIASVMVTAAVELIRRAIEEIATDSADAELDTYSFVLMSLTVCMKIGLYMVCCTFKGSSMSISALATDHFNDVMSNSVAMLGGGLASYYKNTDPIGAIAIGIFIIYNWYQEGLVNIVNLAGRGASPEMIQQLTYVAMNHDERVQQVDTVRAIHLGTNFLVEVDIVLPPEMPLYEAHDIGESLQHKLELLPEVDRAHVHLDFETDHGPEDEHKNL